MTGRPWRVDEAMRVRGFGALAVFIDDYRDAQEAHAREGRRLRLLEHVLADAEKDGFLRFPKDWIAETRALVEAQRRVTQAARENTTLRTRLADHYVVGLPGITTVRQLAILSLLLGDGPTWDRGWTKPEEIIAAEFNLMNKAVSRRRKRRKAP